MVKLQIKDDQGKTTVVPLSRDEVTIGRKEGNTIRLTERNVSRTHARVTKKDDEVHIEDLSRYGTRVNGERIAEAKRIADADVVTIGDYELQLEGAKPTEPPAPPEVPEAKDDAAAASPPPKPAAPNKAGSPARGAEAATAKAETTQAVGIAAVDDAGDGGARKGRGKGRKRIAASHPTLVAVTSQLAGTTYELTGTTMILGRTGENDVLIDHHSISRNHAKIVVDGDQVKMVDLGSKNGLRVNGEFWEESVLKSGDIIELGKVQFRFVEKGEDFVFRPEDYEDVGVADPGVPPKKKGRAWIFLLLFLAVGGAVVGLVLATQGPDVANVDEGGAGGQVDPAAVDEGAPADDEATAEVAGAADPKVETQDNEQAITEAIDAAKGHIQEQRWDEAADQVAKVMALDGENPQGARLEDQIASERAALAAYEAARDAHDAGDLDRAAAGLEELEDLPEDSAYAARVSELRAAVVPALADRAATAAEEAYDAKRYDDAIRHAREAQALVDDHAEAEDIESRARRMKAREAARANRAARAAAPKDDPPDDEADGEDDAPKLTASQLYTQGRNHHHANPEKALEFYKQAAKMGHARAYKQMGSIYLRRDKAAAKAAYANYLRLMPDARDADSVKELINSL